MNMIKVSELYFIDHHFHYVCVRLLLAQLQFPYA